MQLLPTVPEVELSFAHAVAVGVRTGRLIERLGQESRQLAVDLWAVVQ